MKRKRVASAPTRNVMPARPSKLPMRRPLSVAIAPEKKFFDVAVSQPANISTTTVGLTAIGAGDTALLRDGNKLIVKSIHVKLTGANKTLTANNTVRFALVKNLQANGGSTLWTSVYDSSTITAHRNVQTASQYKVIWDEVIDVNQGSDGALQRFSFEKFVKLPPDVTTYAQAAAQDPMTNSYSLLYIGSNVLGATDLSVSGSVRVRFVG